jgi:quinol monooxygenase YgiN
MITIGVNMRIFATIRPNQEHVESAKKAVLNILEETRQEAGCLKFDLYQSADGQTLYLDEEWTDRGALEFHHAQPYTAKVFDAYKEWLRAEPELVELRLVTGHTA